MQPALRAALHLQAQQDFQVALGGVEHWQDCLHTFPLNTQRVSTHKTPPPLLRLLPCLVVFHIYINMISHAPLTRLVSPFVLSFPVPPCFSLFFVFASPILEMSAQIARSAASKSANREAALTWDVLQEKICLGNMRFVPQQVQSHPDEEDKHIYVVCLSSLLWGWSVGPHWNISVTSQVKSFLFI